MLSFETVGQYAEELLIEGYEFQHYSVLRVIRGATDACLVGQHSVNIANRLIAVDIRMKIPLIASWGSRKPLLCIIMLATTTLV